MAQLSPLIQFTAGTPAVASDVNANFSAIRNHINSANIDTENIAATLTSRAGGPILFLDQTSQNEIVFSLQNSQTNTAMQILQSAQLASNKAVLKLEDTYTQAAGKAELWLSLATGSTIPALLVEHGTPTLSLTKTQLNLFNSAIQATATSLNLFSSAIQATPTSLNLFSNAVQATSAGAVTAATLNATTSVAIKNNTSLLEFRDTADAVQFASITGSTSGLDLNLPDTADSYTFKINNVTKAVINNNGIDGQYVYGSTNTTAVIRYQRTFSYFAIGGYRVMASTTISINGPKTGILSFGPGNSPTISQGYDYGGIQPFTVSPDNARFKILIKNGGNIYYEGWYTNFNGGYLQGTVNTTQIFITTFSMPVAGTYTIEFQAAAPFQDVYWGVFPIQILVYTI